MIKLEDIEIKPIQFYLIGKYSFLVSALMSLVSTLDLLISKAAAFTIIGRFSSFIFQMALFGLFAYMLKQERKMVKTDKDLMDIAALLDNGEKGVKAKDGTK